MIHLTSPGYDLRIYKLGVLAVSFSQGGCGYWILLFVENPTRCPEQCLPYGESSQSKRHVRLPATLWLQTWRLHSAKPWSPQEAAGRQKLSPWSQDNNSQENGSNSICPLLNSGTRGNDANSAKPTPGECRDITLPVSGASINKSSPGHDLV